MELIARPVQWPLHHARLGSTVQLSKPSNFPVPQASTAQVKVSTCTNAQMALTVHLNQTNPLTVRPALSVLESLRITMSLLPARTVEEECTPH